MSSQFPSVFGRNLGKKAVEKSCYSDKATTDQVPRRSQRTNNLESSAQFSAAYQVKAKGKKKDQQLHARTSRASNT
jgi:hypothetical protein